MELCERLRSIRGRMGQAEFAKKIGSSQTSVSAYEKGERKPAFDVLFRIAQEFDISLDWLLLDKGEMHVLSENRARKNQATQTDNEKQNPSNPRAKTLGERLFEIRGRLSRKAFAQKYGIHEQTLIRYETDQRTPDNNFIRKISEGEQICEDWIKLGKGPKYFDSQERGHVEMDDTSAVSTNIKNQHFEVIKQNENQMADSSAILQLTQTSLRLSSENGDLRVEVERLRMELERRNRRIEELEKAYNEEHEELMLLKKTLSPSSPQPVQPVTEKELQH